MFSKHTAYKLGQQCCPVHCPLGSNSVQYGPVLFWRNDEESITYLDFRFQAVLSARSERTATGLIACLSNAVCGREVFHARSLRSSKFEAAALIHYQDRFDFEIRFSSYESKTFNSKLLVFCLRGAVSIHFNPFDS